MTVRALTINFWGIEPDLDRRLELLLNQLESLRPDVIGMQEVRPIDGKAGKTTAEFVAGKLGMNFHYAKSLSWQDDDFFQGHPGGEEGLAILSKFPLSEVEVTHLPEARKTEARILLSAKVQGPSDFWFHTTHLHYRLNDGLAREKQVVSIDDVVTAKSVDGQVSILCGDFNAAPSFDEIRFLRGETTLAGRRTHYQDAFLRCHPAEDGHTWCASNPQTRALRSLDIDRRIDYIFVSTRRKDGRGSVSSCQVALTRTDSDGNCCSDHYGVMADVQVSKLT